jgi:hypothetical protein
MLKMTATEVSTNINTGGSPSTKTELSDVPEEDRNSRAATQQWVQKSEVAESSGSSQDKVGLRHESSANDELKQDVEKGQEKAATEQDKDITPKRGEIN